MTSNISIEEMMEKIALENDCNGKMLERYNLVGCSPSVRLEYIDNDDWEVCLSYSILESRECAYCSEEYGILHTSFRGKNAIEALLKLDDFCKKQRSIGAVVCDALGE